MQTTFTAHMRQEITNRLVAKNISIPSLDVIIKCRRSDVNQKYGQIVEKYIRNAPEVEKYVIMPDHIHMIIRLDDMMDGEGTMWASSPTDTGCIHPKNKVASVVRSIKTLTTKEIGKSIFQRSYYDHVIRNQQDYNETWEYIDYNPRKWMITKQVKK